MFILEGSKGEWYCINPGETHITEDGQELTYDRVVEWMHNGELQEHGFRTPTINNECRRDNGDAMRHAQYCQNLLLVAAT